MIEAIHQSSLGMCLTRGQKRYRDNKEAQLIRMKKWRKGKGKEWYKAYQRQYYQKHKDLIHKKCKIYYANHREEKRAALKLRDETYRKQWMVILKEKNLISCSKCGYDKCFAAIDFHHTKEDVTTATRRSKQIGVLIRKKPTDERLRELNQVIPLCSNCHRELHANVWRLK